MLVLTDWKSKDREKSGDAKRTSEMHPFFNYHLKYAPDLPSQSTSSPVSSQVRLPSQSEPLLYHLK